MAILSVTFEPSTEGRVLSVPHTQTFGGYVFSCAGFANQVVPSAPYKADFVDAPPGDHVVQVQLIGQDGATFGNTGSITLSVPYPNVDFIEPVTLSGLVGTVTA